LNPAKIASILCGIEPCKKQPQYYGGIEPSKKNPTSILWGYRTQQKKKNSLNLLGEFPSKEHWQICYGTLLDNFLKIGAIIGDIIYLWVC
jgi:hypothetical protein